MQLFRRERVGGGGVEVRPTALLSIFAAAAWAMEVRPTALLSNIAAAAAAKA